MMDDSDRIQPGFPGLYYINPFVFIVLRQLRTLLLPVCPWTDNRGTKVGPFKRWTMFEPFPN